MSTPSAFLTYAFAALGVLVASAFPLAVFHATRAAGAPVSRARRDALLAGAGTAAWLALTAGAAARGALTFAGTPPTMVVLIVGMIALAVGIALSPLGARLATHLPLAALVGIHAFRLPLELLMHRAYEEGVMPVQMSYSGLNFDILSGIGAIVVAALLAAGRIPPAGVRAWNAAAFLLLLNVMTIANLSTPTPLRVFAGEPANVWVTRAPFVWLPAVMVLTALAGHLVLFRRLRIDARAAAARRVPERAGVSV